MDVVRQVSSAVYETTAGQNTKPATMATQGQWLQARTMPVEAGHRYVCMTAWNGNTIGCWDQIHRSVLLRLIKCRCEVQPSVAA